MRGKCQGFVLYRQTWQCNENITDCGGGGGGGGGKGRGFTNWMPPQCGAFSRDLQDKSQSPRYSPGVGGAWLQMTSAFVHYNSPGDARKLAMRHAMRKPTYHHRSTGRVKEI